MRRIFKGMLAISLVVTLVLGPTSVSRSAGITFTDVPTTSWAYADISWAVENGIVKGYSDGSFRPNANVTEAEFIAMLLSAYKTDYPAPSGKLWYQKYYDSAKSLNWDLSTTRRDAEYVQKKKLTETSPVTRGQVAQILCYALGVDLKGDEITAIWMLLNTGLSKGDNKAKNNELIKNFHAESPLTRAEAVTFIRNLYNKQPKLTTLPEKMNLLHAAKNGELEGKWGFFLEQNHLDLKKMVLDENVLFYQLTYQKNPKTLSPRIQVSGSIWGYSSAHFGYNGFTEGTSFEDILKLNYQVAKYIVGDSLSLSYEQFKNQLQEQHYLVASPYIFMLQRNDVAGKSSFGDYPFIDEGIPSFSVY